ncbi:MAG: 60S ribosomal export protein NMD3 [Thermoplasmatota archaeon]
MLCVDCGKEVDHLIGGSCASCFTERTKLLVAPEVVDIELCSHCRARHVGAHWVEADQELPMAWLREDAVRGALGVHERVDDVEVELLEEQKTEHQFDYQVVMSGQVDEVPVTAGATLQLRVRKGSCDRCSRLAGGYYAAILQLRASERDVTAGELALAHKLTSTELDRQLDAGNRFAFMAKEGPMHGGWDYYLGDIDAGRAVARTLQNRLGASVHESAKLVGRREGEDVYRVTFLVRLNLYSAGDVALETDRDAVVQVVQVARGQAACVDLTSYRRLKIPEKRLRRLGGDELFQEAVVVSREPGSMQLLDPVSLRAVDVPTPPDGAPEGDVAPVLRHEERLYLPALLPAAAAADPSRPNKA